MGRGCVQGGRGAAAQGLGGTRPTQVQGPTDPPNKVRADSRETSPTGKELVMPYDPGCWCGDKAQ